MSGRNGPESRHWLQINRAPVLTLWAAVVAERIGFDRDEALTLGRAVAGLNAYSKGKSLGIFKPGKKTISETRKSLEKGKTITVDLLNRAVPAIRCDEGLRAVSKDKPIRPDSVERYLGGKFDDALDDARAAMSMLAEAYSPAELAKHAYRLYEQFRPQIPSGTKGWGANGRLSLDAIRKLAKQAAKA